MATSSRICLVTSDCQLFQQNVSVETTLFSLIKFLNEQNFDVTLFIYLRNVSLKQQQEALQQYFQEHNIDVNIVFQNQHVVLEKSHQYYQRDSYSCMQTLKALEHDVIYFYNQSVLAFYSVLAKQQGLAFVKAKLVVSVCAPGIWDVLHEKCGVELNDLIKTTMEQYCLQYADVVVPASDYIFGWLKQHHWKLSADMAVIHNLFKEKNKQQQPENNKLHAFNNKIAFYGCFSYRAGFKHFLDVMQKLSDNGLINDSFELIFFGDYRNNTLAFNPRLLFKTFKRGINCKVTVVSDLGIDKTVTYLKENDCLVVMPALAESSGNFVSECIAHGLPFLAYDVGIVPELVAIEDQKNCLLKPSEYELYQRLKLIIESGQMYTANINANLSLAAIKQQYLQVVNPTAEKRYLTECPKVTVCISHYNRPEYLQTTINSLFMQDYQNFNIVIVDDGSNTLKAKTLLSNLERQHSDKIKVIYQENQYVNAARNTAVKHADGEYVLLMDDDNFALSDQISTFVTAAVNSGADALTCFSFLVETNKDLTPEMCDQRKMYLPLGFGVGVNFFKNQYGDANGFFKKEVLQAIGGYIDEPDVACEDWNLYARLVTQGYNIQVVPKPLFIYRICRSHLMHINDSVSAHFFALEGFGYEHYGELYLALLHLISQRKQDMFSLSFRKFMRNYIHSKLLMIYQKYKRYKIMGFVKKCYDATRLLWAYFN